MKSENIQENGSYAIVPSRPDRVLGPHIGIEDASQRAGIPDIWYLYGPGRLLASQLLGVTGILVLLSIPLSILAWSFVLDTLSLLLGRIPKGF